MTIQEFIEERKKNIRSSAEAEVRRRYLESHKESTDPASMADEYIKSPDGENRIRSMLGRNKLYKEMCSADPAGSPIVQEAYRSSSGKKRKRRRRKKTSQQKARSRLFKDYCAYSFTESELEELEAEISRDVENYFSDLKHLVPARRIEQLYYAPASEELLSAFVSEAESGMNLSSKLLEDIVRRSRSNPYDSINRMMRYTAAERVFERCDIPDDRRLKLRNDFWSALKKPHPQKNALTGRIMKRFSHEYISSIVTESADYRAVTTYLENELILGRNARELILREIPAQAIDLYPAARKINRHFILHLGPTNSGKTYQALQALKRANKGVYLAPLRLLAYEICEQFNLDGVPCNMVTGEEEIIVPFASHVSSTVEMLSTAVQYDVAVVDECQLIEDEQRGGSWTSAVLGLVAGEIHLCASPSAEDILISLIKLCGDTYEIVRHERFVPLLPDRSEFRFPESVRSRDALIVFTKNSVLSYAEKLREAGIRASVIYGDLPYDVRRSEVARFVSGETDVVVSTDAIGMGLNLPVRRVVFLETFKFDGRRRRFLRSSEIKQIAGRAGRRGIFDTGWYCAADFAGRVRGGMNKPDKPVKSARLGFPDTVLTVDMPLSELLLRWSMIPDDELFLKNNMTREIQLSRELERFTQDRFLVFRFVTIPFNERNQELYAFWLSLFRAEVSGRKVTVREAAAEIRYADAGLEGLELAYRKSDVLYFYTSRFGDKDELPMVLELKHDISGRMMKILAER